MPQRKQQLVTHHYYHIFNRGAGKQIIFLDNYDRTTFLNHINHYSRFDIAFSRYNDAKQVSLTNGISELEFEKSFLLLYGIKPPIRILAYCLMPNHYHFIFEQLVDDGILFFMRKIGNSYAHYFNLKHNSSGTLFQGRFKSVFVEDQNQLEYLSRYIHRNPLSLQEINIGNLSSYPWSSLPIYLSEKAVQTIETLDISPIFLSFNNDRNKYLEYIDQTATETEKQTLQHTTIDNDFGWYKGTK